MEFSSETKKLLDIIEANMDEDAEEDVLRQWKAFADHKTDCEIFRQHRKKVAQVDYTEKKININDAIENYELMFVNEVQSILRTICSENWLPSVRANYGTGILPSLFGAEVFMMPYEQNTLPAVRSMGDSAIDRILDKGEPCLTNGFGRQVLEMGEIFAENFAKYPKINKYVTAYHPDLQGPLDVCEVIVGTCEMIYAMVDEPDKVKALLDLICKTYTDFINKWYAIFPPEPDYNIHWGSFLFRGTIALRDDSAMNLTPEMYREFAMPYDALLLDRFGGGMIHFCGRGDHYIEDMSSIPKLYGINLSQPELNDMEKIYRNTVDKNIPILGFNAQYAEKDKNREGGFHGNLHV